ncbi:phospholipid phosphatase [Leuconostoc sp. S50]|uniref:phospholipid phosphatase n=1 Tax=Leuconostoc sp. S50 TaxID=2767461 RepID=UPI00351C2C67
MNGSVFVLIQPDKLRKLLIIIFGVVFIVFCLAVRFNAVLVAFGDDAATLVVQNMLPHSLQALITIGHLFAHYWLVLPFIALMAGVLYLAQYKIAMWWFIISQIMGMLVCLIVAIVVGISWDSGLQLRDMMPNLLLVWWLQVLFLVVALILPRLLKSRRLQIIMSTLIGAFWLFMMISLMQANNMLLSSGIGALLFGYFWWQLSAQIYRKRARQWQHVLKIDGRV